MRILHGTDKVNTVRTGVTHITPTSRASRDTAIECGFGAVVMSGWERKSLHYMCVVYKTESEWI